jgi:hypothetical protein
VDVLPISLQAKAVKPLLPVASDYWGNNMDEQMLGEIENAGRGTDTVVGHLTVGEIVIPAELAREPEAQKIINALFANAQIDVNEFTVGHQANKINPETGYPEFKLLKSIFKPITSAISSVAKAIGLAPKAPDMTEAIKAQERSAKAAEDAAIRARGPQTDASIMSAQEKDQLRRRRGRAANILAQEDEPISVGARRLLGY